MGSIIVELDPGDPQMRERRRRDPGDVGREYYTTEEVDEILTAISPKTKPRQKTLVCHPPTVGESEKLWVVSFDGSARVKRKSGAYSAVIWELPGWKIVAAASEYTSDLTVNEAEYRGLILGLDY